MKHLITALALCATAFAPVFVSSAQATSHKEAPDMAASAAKAPTAQQSKMKSCNADAKGKTGDDRKTFMKQCLSAAGSPSAMADGKTMTTQQTKMKSCNTDAKGKTGDDRKTFMKECLSK